MTLKEFDVQVALGLIPFTFTSKRLQNKGKYEVEIDFVLELGNEKYSSKDYSWMAELYNFTALHYQIYTDYNINIIKLILIEEGILI